jgi:hypothetical protein
MNPRWIIGALLGRPRPGAAAGLAASLLLLEAALPVTARASTGCPGNGTNSAVVAEYLFLEGAGSAVGNTGTDGDDGNAALTNGAAFHADVPPNNNDCGWSVELPSSGTGAGTPAMESDADYDPLAGADRFTLMAWVRRQSGGANSNTSARIVSDTSSLSLNTNTAGFEFRFSGSAGTLALRVNGNEVSTGVGGIAPHSNVWKHVAVVYDGTRPATNTLTRHVHFYVDGIQRGDGNTLPDQIVGANTSRLTIGNSAVSRGIANLLVGKVDDVFILWGYAPDAVGNGKTNETIRCFMLADDDIVPPSIAPPSDLTVHVDAGECEASGVNLGTPVTSDNCAVAGVDNDAPASYPLGVTVVTWVATDTAGLTSDGEQRVTVVDPEPPAIACPADVTVEAGPCLAAVTNLALDDAVYSDNCGVAGWASIAPAAYGVGVTSVLWRVWDASGNTNSCQQQVTVIPSATADCDGDGLTDFEEVEVYGSDYSNPSTAGDGLSDGWKVQYGFHPTNPVPPECRPTYW